MFGFSRKKTSNTTVSFSCVSKYPCIMVNSYKSVNKVRFLVFIILYTPLWKMTARMHGGKAFCQMPPNLPIGSYTSAAFLFIVS